ncbi:MAG: hypothetical protein LLF86_02390 [Nitrospiraceae bacterium]|nr:hypothetical protein [Nitrospiraceae bacterium]
MKEAPYTRIICAESCAFYKPGKEEMHCGGYLFLKQHLSAKELSALLPGSKQKSYVRGSAKDRWIMKKVCSRCDFLVDGCDFRDNLASPPCGGCIIIYSLIR